MPALADLTWSDAGERLDAILAVPVGSTEQHGPHLPLSTDTDIAVALGEALAVRRRDVVVAPPVAYGASGEHQAFPGTLSIGQAALETLLVELGRSATETFDRIVFVNAHGGNAAPLARAVRLLAAESRDVLAWSPSYDTDAHAGYDETSLLLAIAPERVRRADDIEGNTRPLADLLPGLRAGRLREVSPTGVLGDRREATAEHGRMLLDRLADGLTTAVATHWPS
jgi:creatinine amidohydrolase